MRPLHLLLAASLAANALTLAAYLYTQREAHRLTIAPDGMTVLNRLALTPEQTKQLAETQRTLRSTLSGLRAETAGLFETAVVKLRDAKPGDTSYEAALQATGEVRRRQTTVIARELIAFREHLTPAQREIFNQHIGDWSFIEVMIGLPPDIMKGPPSGPFRAPPPKNGR
jgi:hypothetical protein